MSSRQAITLTNLLRLLIGQSLIVGFIFTLSRRFEAKRLTKKIYRRAGEIVKSTRWLRTIFTQLTPPYRKQKHRI